MVSLLVFCTNTAGFIASISGWLTAEIGRQPWVVYGLLRTHDAVSAISAEDVIISFVLLVLAYGVVFGFYLYYLLKLIRLGPEIIEQEQVEHHAFQYMTDLNVEKNNASTNFAVLLAFIVMMYVILDGFDLELEFYFLLPVVKAKGIR